MIPHVDRPMVYIAGPFTSHPIVGTRQAIRTAERLEATGLITPCIPHFNLLWDLVHSHDNDFWYSYDLAFLNRCDALFRIPGVSPGADDEVDFADEHNIEVFYEFDDLIAWAQSFVTSNG